MVKLSKRFAPEVTVAFILLILSLLIYGQTLGFSFLHWDDHFNILERPGLNLKALKEIWIKPYYGLYIPVSYTVWGVLSAGVRLFQEGLSTKNSALNPAAFHGFNLLLHWFNSVQVYLLLQFWLVRKKANSPSISAAFGAIFFLVHPLQVESVAWASGMRDLLSAAFGLLATQISFRHLFGENPSAKGKEWVLGGGATLAFFLGVLSKPALIVLPLAIFFLGWCEKINFSIRERRYLILWILMLPLSALSTRLAQNWAVIPDSNLLERLLIAVDSLGFYILKILFPFHLAADYGRTPDWVIQRLLDSFLDPSSLANGELGTVLAFVLTLIGLLLFWKKTGFTSTVQAGLGWFLISLLPVLGWISFAQQSISTVTDHYIYFPMVGFAFLSAEAFEKWGFGFSWKSAGLRAILLGFTALSFLRCQVWANDEVFFQAMLTANPQSAQGYTGMGDTRADQGRFEEALSQFRKSIEINPGNATAVVNYFVALEKLGRFEDIVREEEYFTLKYIQDDALSESLHPETVSYWTSLLNTLAHAQIRLHQFEKAQDSLCRSLRLNSQLQWTLNLVQLFKSEAPSRSLNCYR